MARANDFTKLAAAMANIDPVTEDDQQNLNAAQMSDALKALADVAATDNETYQLGWVSALKAAQLRAAKGD